MTTTIVTIGGRMAAEGLAMLDNAGIECISTEPYLAQAAQLGVEAG
jgi:D-3-phosphoglycerate dehydrogenase